jgi:hypothetical protein
VCPASGCLFNVATDPTEAHEASAAHPQLVASLSAQLKEAAAGIWSTNHKDDPQCRSICTKHYGNFYGPFRELE